MKINIPICLLWALCAWPGLPATQAQSNAVIYSSGLQNGWQDWSWATVNLANTNPVFPGYSHSISVSCASYTALYLKHAAFDSGPFANLTFWLDGGTSGGQVLTIKAVLGGTAQSRTQLIGPLAPGGFWQQFTIPLAALGAADVKNLDGFWIFNNSASTIPTFYVNGIILTAKPARDANSANSLQSAR